MYSDYPRLIRISKKAYKLVKKESEKNKKSMAKIICEIVILYFQNYDKFNS